MMCLDKRLDGCRERGGYLYEEIGDLDFSVPRALLAGCLRDVLKIEEGCGGEIESVRGGLALKIGLLEKAIERKERGDELVARLAKVLSGGDGGAEVFMGLSRLIGESFRQELRNLYKQLEEVAAEVGEWDPFNALQLAHLQEAIERRLGEVY